MIIFQTFYEENFIDKNNVEQTIYNIQGWLREKDAIDFAKKLISKNSFKEIEDSGYLYCAEWKNKKHRAYTFVCKGQIK